MAIKQALADAAHFVLRTTDKEYASEVRDYRPTTRSGLSALTTNVRSDNIESVVGHAVAAIPIIGVGVDALLWFAAMDQPDATLRSVFGKFFSLSLNAGSVIAAAALGAWPLLFAGAAYHAVMAGVDATQAAVYPFVAKNASLPAPERTAS